jgi:hypothetical protein
MRVEIRTLLRSISTLVVLLTLVFGASIGVSAQERGHRSGRHDNGRHLGWTVGRHRGWSHSRQRGVRRNDNLGGIFRRNRRGDRDVLTRRDDNRGMDMRGHGRGHGRH